MAEKKSATAALLALPDVEGEEGPGGGGDAGATGCFLGSGATKD